MNAVFVIRRLVEALTVMLAASALTFLIFAVIPNGDPATRMAGRQPDPRQVEAIRKEWGMDKSLVSQYATMVRKVVTGDVTSYATRTNVIEEIAARAPRTASLALIAIGTALAIAIAGAAIDPKRGRRRSNPGLAALVAISVPSFWLAAVLADLVGFRWGLLPDGGYVPLTQDALDWFAHLILPGIALGLAAAGLYFHLVARHLSDELGAAHVTATIARGVGPRRVLWRHAMPGALVPAIPLVALDLGVMFAGGAVLIESAFGIQGIGQYAATAVADLDVPVVVVVTMLGAFTIAAVNACADLAVAAIRKQELD